MNKTIENLKKLKSFHNGSYGADIDKAIKALEQQDVLNQIRAEIENHCGLAKENHCKYCYHCNNVMGVREILEIIDKYRSEEV